MPVETEIKRRHYKRELAEEQLQHNQTRRELAKFAYVPDWLAAVCTFFRKPI